MFDNLLYQNASSLLKDDILSNRLPGAILLSGPQASGKLTCALEIARILSCSGDNQYNQRGHWLCECPSCKKNKELSNTNVLLAGPRDCSLEILAAKKAFLQASFDNSRYLTAVRYLFIRSVRKLTMRFSQVLWEGDDKLSKLSPIMVAIDEDMEKLNPEKPLPDSDKLEKICDSIVKNCDKLESGFMYDSLPINQIRRASVWAHMKSVSGKKVFIIENAERMLESVRNALLKILEEPPEDMVFILTTSNRGAVMPTILSRVRTYNFTERSAVQQKEVVQRVFHARGDEENLLINDYLQLFLPVKPVEIKKAASAYFSHVMSGQIPLSDSVIKECSGFEPRFLLKIFLVGIMEEAKGGELTPQRAEICAKITGFCRECYNSVTVYNISPAAVIEKLSRDLAGLRRAM
ncbi:MAG: DNA polymerase III [Treponema sp.]|uniref:DNA polymerase III n=1 Tax=Treponema sp. TaxID=166 RepID=UPI002A9195A9|nr:DNA polymerase III [Treponema sp.]MDY6398425.1 DNA polymerase III [Treponema sp.]